MKRLAFLVIGLLLTAAPVLAGCSQAENAVGPAATHTTAATSPATTAETTTSVAAAAASSCVSCHTDKAELQATASNEVVAKPTEASGEG
jgi:mono/diheme cytochrome c family protein